MNVTLACSDEVLDDTCIVNNSILDGCDRESSKLAILVSFCGNSQTIPPLTLKAVANSSISADFLLISTKLYTAYLELCGSSNATITIFHESPPREKPDSVELYFLRRVDFLQWYEANSVSKVSSKWPKQLSLALVERCLPQLLSHSYLIHGKVIIVSNFGQLYFFKVNTPLNDDTGFAITNLRTKYHIIVQTNDDLPSLSLLYQDQLSYLQPSLTDAVTSIQQFLSADLHPLAFTSTLYTAPQGSGKTTFFHILQKHILSLYKNTRVIYLDVLTNISSLFVSCLHSDMTIQEILDIFIKLSTEKSSTMTHNFDYDSTIIFVDHLDVVFTTFISDLQDSNNIAMTGAQQHDTFGYLLHHLLNLIKQSTNNKVMVIGACRMNTAQLPRGSSGCPDFERVISIPKPDEHDRFLLLQYLFIKYILDIEERDLLSLKLAQLTRGYLPGDLSRLVNHSLSISNSPSAQTPNVTWDNVMKAMASTSCVPQALLDLQQLQQNSNSSSAGNKLWESFLGYSQVKHDFLRITRRLNVSNKSNALLARSQPSRGMVLYGPSGCGKTHICHILAHQMSMNLVTIQCTDLLSKYFGDTEAKIRNVFAAARAAAPCMLVFDNFESLAHRRGLDTTSSGSNPFARSGESNSSSENEEIGNRILSTFLNELDGIAAASTMLLEQSIFVVAACSDVKILDEALVRPGRLQHHIHLDYPTLDDILAILHHQLLNTALEPTLNFHQLAEQIMMSKGMFSKVSSGQVIDICTSAKMIALEEAVDKYQLRDRNISAKYIEEEAKSFEEEMVCDRHFQKVLAPEVVASIPFKPYL